MMISLQQLTAIEKSMIFWQPLLAVELDNDQIHER